MNNILRHCKQSVPRMVNETPALSDRYFGPLLSLSEDQRVLFTDMFQRSSIELRSGLIEGHFRMV